MQSVGTQCDVCGCPYAEGDGEVAVGVQPEAAAPTPDNAFLYVCNAESDSVSVIDIARKQVVKEIKVGDWPSGIKITKDGKTAYVACSGCMWNTIDVIDTGKMEKVVQGRWTYLRTARRWQ